MLQHICVMVLFGFVDVSTARDSLTVNEPSCSDFEKGIGIITFCLDLDYENCSCDPTNPKTLKFKDDIVSYVRPILEEALGIRLNVQVLLFLRGSVNVQLEVSKLVKSTLTPRELNTLTTALEQRIANNNSSMVIGGTVYRKNCVSYVTVKKKPANEVANVPVDLGDPCFLFKSFNLNACGNGGVCLACGGFPLCICKARWTGEYCTKYEPSKGPDSLQCYAPTLTTPLSNTTKISTTKPLTAEVTVTKPSTIRPTKVKRERLADEEKSGIWIIVAAGSTAFVLIIITCFVLLYCWPCGTEKRTRKPVAYSYVYPHWRPCGSPCYGTISASPSVSSQDTDCVNPLLYELMNYKPRNKPYYSMISLLYHTPQDTRCQPYRKVKKTNSRLNAEQARPQVGVVPMRLRPCHPKEWGMELASHQDVGCLYLGGESRWLHAPDHFQNHTSMFQSEEPKGSINWLHMGRTPSLTSEASMTISIPNNDETCH